MAGPSLALSIQYAVDRSGLPGRAELRRWASAALLHDAEVTLRFVDAEEGQALNRDYRGKDYATNVLTFVYDEEDGYPPGLIAGDIVLCTPVVTREATEQGKDVSAHYAHLVIHGMLHLQDYDHEHELDAAAMEALESFIMLKLGLPDPYDTDERRQ